MVHIKQVELSHFKSFGGTTKVPKIADGVSTEVCGGGGFKVAKSAKKIPLKQGNCKIEGGALSDLALNPNSATMCRDCHLGKG